MCLSTVYLLHSDTDKELLCKNIASLESKDDKLILKNVMGIPTVVEGEISHIDLVDNYIFIRPKA